MGRRREIVNLIDVLEKLQNRTPAILGSENFKKYSVLLPLLEKEDGIHVLFEVRSHQLRRQPGEICFPGGKMDPEDKDEEFSAIRETSEELRIKKSEVKSVFPLDYMVSPFGMIIYPYVGILSDAENLNPNPSEVEEIFTVPLTYFLENKPDIYHVNFEVKPQDGFPFHLIAGGENYNWQARKMDEIFYQYDGRVIWGLTARVLYHFIKVISN
nr:CoA pyrophosphatase [Neobacillus terrae]